MSSNRTLCDMNNVCHTYFVLSFFLHLWNGNECSDMSCSRKKRKKEKFPERKINIYLHIFMCIEMKESKKPALSGRTMCQGCKGAPLYYQLSPHRHWFSFTDKLDPFSTWLHYPLEYNCQPQPSSWEFWKAFFSDHWSLSREIKSSALSEQKLIWWSVLLQSNVQLVLVYYYLN